MWCVCAALTDKDRSLCHITSPLSRPRTDREPRQVVGYLVLGARSMPNFELVWLQGKIPSGHTRVVILHCVDPCQGSVICFKDKLPSQQVVPNAHLIARPSFSTVEY